MTKDEDSHTRRTGHVGTTPELYEVYRANDERPELEWVIQGTDGKLYLVPAEPGG